MELVLLFGVFEYALETYLDFRQLHRFRQAEVPQDIKEIVSEEQFTKAQTYNRDLKEFSLLHGFFTFFDEVVFTYFFITPWLWTKCGNFLAHLGFYPFNEITRGAVFLLLSSLFDLVTGTPWTLYKTFVIQERHGFNKKTLRLFLTDTAKSFALTIVIGGPIYYVLMLIFMWGGQRFYLIVFAFVFVLTFVMMYIFPNFI